MNVNGYEITDEPTREEFAIYFMVERYFEEEWMAQRESTHENRLTQDEFELLCHRYHKGDFSAEQAEYADYLRDEILAERS